MLSFSIKRLPKPLWPLCENYVKSQWPLCGHCVATVWPLRGHCVATAVVILLVVRLPPIRPYGLTQSLPNQLEASVDIQRLTTRQTLALATMASIVASGVSRISFYDRGTIGRNLAPSYWPHSWHILVFICPAAAYKVQ